MVQKHLKPEIAQLVQRYKVLLEQKIRVSQVIVFGSQSKGTAGRYSDIDVCVVSPQFGHDRHDERMMLSKLTDNVDLRIEPHPYHPDDLTDPWDSLAYEIREYGVVV